ncbi:MAG: cell division protein ZipA [Pseudohongiellaceae bacterium]|nr:cell division protein ZipA [Pseudohongiellaceae bacterium]
MGLRELFILVLGLAIVAVFLRGVYVAIKARKNQIRVKLEQNIPDYDPDELTLSELPNGGARLVERSFARVVQQNSDLAERESTPGGKGIPVLMDSVEEQARPSTIANARNAARQKHVMGRADETDDLTEQSPALDDTELREFEADIPVVTDEVPTVTEKVEVVDEDDELELEASGGADYDDPLANHVFADESAETGELSPESYSADDDYEDDYEEDDDYEDESESLVGSGSFDSDDIIESDSELGFTDEDVLEQDHDEFEEADFSGDGQEFEPDDQLDSDDLNPSAGWDDEELEGEDDEEIESEPFDSVYADEEDDTQASADVAQEDDEEESFEADDYDDYDDYEPEPVHANEPSGPRNWLKWAGDKIHGFSAQREERPMPAPHERAEPSIGADNFDEVLEPAPQPKPAARPARPAAKPAESEPRKASIEQSQLDLGLPEEEPAPAPKKSRAARKAADNQPSPKTESTKSAASPASEFSEVLVINVMAKPGQEIAGIDMLQVLMANGLVFGDMNIFHRHLDHNRESPVLFSVANMLNPGTFDLNEIADFSTKGLCFFLTLPNVATSMQAFEKMLDAAQQIRGALDCDLKDDSRSDMTAQTIEHYRQRVRDFDLKQLRQSK